LLLRLAVAPDHDGDERAEREERERSPRAHGAERERAVFSDPRIVVVTEQKELIDDRAELALRGLDEREAKVLRRVFDAEEVTRDLAFRREDDDARRVGVLARRRVPHVAEAGRAGHAADLR